MPKLVSKCLREKTYLQGMISNSSIILEMKKSSPKFILILGMMLEQYSNNIL